MEKVSVRDISCKTGYSPATVSKALNRKPGVSKRTVSIVLKVAAEMGYRRTENVKRVKFVLARKNGSIIDESMFHASVIEGVESEARRYGLPTEFVHIDAVDSNNYRSQVVELCRDMSSAIVLLGTELQEPDFMPFRNPAAKLVVLDSYSDTYSFDSVLIANESSVYNAICHLIKCGHRRIGYLAGDFRIHSFRCRERGYMRALKDAGITVDPSVRVQLRTTLEHAHDDMCSWLATSPDMPTAFFADNDILAVSALRALGEAGYACPDDISIIGFDDLRIGAFSAPPLTTIHVHKREIGQLAVQLLMKKINKPEKYTCCIQMSTEFLKRGSIRNI